MESDIRKYITPEMLKNFDSVKDRIICRMMNLERNGDYLEGKPFMKVGDMAATYHVHLGNKGGKSYSVALTDIHMRSYGITQEELHKAAVDNMEKNPVSFQPMYDYCRDIILRDLAQNGYSREEAGTEAERITGGHMDPDGGGMYVLTNESGISGAAQMLNPKALDEAARECGGGLFILPSSVHEVLIMPKNTCMDYRELEGMLREVNAAEVALEDQLSDYVYEYDSGSKTITRCDMPEERISVKMQDMKKNHKENRISLITDLEEKKKQAAGLNKASAKTRKNCMELG